MKNLKLFTLAIAILGFSTVSFAQSASATGSVRLLTPITIVKNLDLRFGSVLTNNAAGTVVIGTSSATDRTMGTYTDLTTGADAYGAAKFTVSGTKSQKFAVTLPTSLQLTGPGAALTVNEFTTDFPTGGTLDETGTKIILVGATLTIPANQEGGVYSGTFNVTVAYN